MTNTTVISLIVTSILEIEEAVEYAKCDIGSLMASRIKLRIDQLLGDDRNVE